MTSTGRLDPGGSGDRARYTAAREDNEAMNRIVGKDIHKTKQLGISKREGSYPRHSFSCSTRSPIRKCVAYLSNTQKPTDFVTFTMDSILPQISYLRLADDSSRSRFSEEFPTNCVGGDTEDILRRSGNALTRQTRFVDPAL